mgnify:CR=1 FL=1
MKTSLVIDDRVFEEAKKEAAKSGRTISEVISKWAQIGREAWRQTQKNKKITDFKAQNLGSPQVDLSSRKDWMEELERDGD